MTRSAWLKLSFQNLLLMALIALPILLVILAITNRKQITDPLGEATILYVGFGIPMLLGAIPYLLSLYALAWAWPKHARLLAVLLTPLMALGWVVLGMTSFFDTLGFLIAFGASVLTFGMVVRTTPRREGS